MQLRKLVARLLGERLKTSIKSLLFPREPLSSKFLERLSPSPLRTWRRRRIFQTIYAKKLWGGDKSGQFFSGGGSRGAAAEAYVDRIAAFLAERARHAERPL